MEHVIDQNSGIAASLDRRAEREARHAQYVFVGEKRSRRAIALSASWTDGRLCAKTLHEALRAVGLDPRSQVYLNLYHDGDGWSVNPAALARLRSLIGTGVVIVGLGRRVQTALRRAGLPHRSLTHPAARGAVRGRAVYRSRVARALGRDRAAA